MCYLSVEDVEQTGADERHFRKELAMTDQICACCERATIETGIRLNSGWVDVCRRCADAIAAQIASEGDAAPGVIMRSAAARRAFDDAYDNGHGATVAEAGAIALEVEAAILRAGVRAATARRLIAPLATWSTPAYA